MKKDFSSASGHLMSFRHALCGLRILVKTQRNARVHAVATVMVVAAGCWCGVSRIEWCALVLVCAGVWTAEALNTALEFLADAVTKEKHPLIGHAKDVAAGAVLVMAITAMVVGCVVFMPYVLRAS